MPNLNFSVEAVAPVPYAAVPLLSFRIALTNTRTAEQIFSVALRCQIQIEVTNRRYTEPERARLLDLFGEPDRWSRTLRNMHWTNVTATASAFTSETTVEMQVPCTFDFNVAATKYFHGLASGDIPLCLMFSGTVFYEGGDGATLVAPISWSKEARFRLPLATWREMMDIYYPNSAWLCLRRDVFERLNQYKTRHAIPSWEAALERILQECEELVQP